MGLSWVSDSPSVARVDSSGRVTVISGGTAKITASLSTRSSTYTACYRLLVADKIFFIDSYYDSSLANTSDLNLIYESVYGVSKGYYDLFGVGFALSGQSTLATDLQIDTCTLGAETLCTNSVCGTNCSTMHHKSRYRILNELNNYSRQANHITVLWSSRPSSSYCVINSDTGVHRATAAIAQAGPFASHIITILGTTSADREAYMCLVLAHEIAHNMGLPEVNNIVENHEVNGSFQCVMELYETANQCHITYYEDILDGSASMFCDYCQEQLLSLIANKYS